MRYALILTLVLMLIPGPVAARSSGGYIYSGEETDIVGYDNYYLMEPAVDFSWRDWFGPQVDASVPNVVNTYYTRSETISTNAGSSDAVLGLHLYDGRVQWICLTFPNLLAEFTSLSDTRDFVIELRQDILQKYDSDLVLTDSFVWDYNLDLGDGWYGILMLKDEDGDALFLYWKGYEVTVNYMTVDFTEDYLREYNGAIEDQPDKF